MPEVAECGIGAAGSAPLPRGFTKPTRQPCSQADGKPPPEPPVFPGFIIIEKHMKEPLSSSILD